LIGSCKKAIYQRDERLIQRFIEGNTDPWLEEGYPFHLWLTCPAGEILDLTFAMNLGSAKNREDCADLIVYQSARQPPGDSIYHPTWSDHSSTKQAAYFESRIRYTVEVTESERMPTPVTDACRRSARN
jgi:hypothetical protein